MLRALCCSALVALVAPASAVALTGHALARPTLHGAPMSASATTGAGGSAASTAPAAGASSPMSRPLWRGFAVSERWPFGGFVGFAPPAVEPRTAPPQPGAPETASPQATEEVGAACPELLVWSPSLGRAIRHSLCPGDPPPL